MEKEKLTPVTKGEVKKSSAQEFKELFFPETPNAVGDYIFKDIVVPAIKNLVIDIVSDGVNMLLTGKTGRAGYSGASNVSYQKYYKGTETVRTTVRDDNFLGDVVVYSYEDAKEVLSRLNETIQQFGSASVGDLYALIGKTCPHTALKYGWKDIRMATVVKVREGYLLKMPKAIPID